MKVTRTSQLSGHTNEREIDVDPDKLALYVSGFFEPKLIQNVFMELGPDDREFIMTGITPEEWNATFGEE